MKCVANGAEGIEFAHKYLSQKLIGELQCSKVFLYEVFHNGKVL